MQRSLFLLFLSCCLFQQLRAQNSLQDYIDIARQNNPQLRDNKNQTQLNQLEADRLKAVYTKPQIGLTAGYLFAPIISSDKGHPTFEANSYAADNYVGYDLAASNGGTYMGLITYNQPLFNGSTYESYENQTEVNKLINQNTIKLTEHDIEKTVTDQYILCLLDKKQILFMDSLLKLLEEQILITEKMVENGFAKQSDLSLLNIEYQNNLGLSTAYKATYRRDLMDLNVRCGIIDTTNIWLNDVNLSLKPEVAQSHYLQKYALDSLNVLAGQSIFETKYKPQVNFYSNAGLNAVYAPTLPRRFGVSAGLNLTWNFYDGNQKSITREKSDLQMQSIAFYRDNFIAQNEMRKNKILTELQSYNKRMNIAKDQLKEYQTLLATYKKEIVQGQLSILLYITTLKSMITLQRDYFLIETNRLLLINAYNYWNW